MVLKAHAKINLILDILGRDQSGFHEIKTVYHLLPHVFDEIELELLDSNEIIIECDDSDVPSDTTNTAYKAAMLLQHYKMPQKQASRAPLARASGARIVIKKRIPLFSGLGGGSSNAATVLKGLNELWNLNLPQETLAGLGCQIGMDVPFFFTGGTALGAHFGEKIEPLSSLPPSLHFEIIDTGVRIASKWAYENIDMHTCGRETGKTNMLIAALKRSDAEGVLQNIHNDFETLIFERYPELLGMKNKTLSSGADHVFLTGSGGALAVINKK